MQKISGRMFDKIGNFIGKTKFVDSIDNAIEWGKTKKSKNKEKYRGVYVLFYNDKMEAIDSKIVLLP